jgi:hypothetical protein
VDDTSSQSHFFAVPGEQTHSFHVPGDVDWVKFRAEAGRTYVIETLNLMSNTDTVLELYDVDQTTLLARDDDGGRVPPASRIVYTLMLSGSYFVRVRNFNPYLGGCDYVYDLSISLPSTPTATPTPITCPDFMDPPGVGTEDIQASVSHWRRGTGSPYDIDKDGWVTVADTMRVAARWGDACP